MSYADEVTEHRRLCLLRVLAAAPGYAGNDSILRGALDSFGLAASRDTVRAELAWLDEQGLIQSNDLAGVIVATITERGLDVAAGRAQVPGVKRPGPH